MLKALIQLSLRYRGIVVTLAYMVTAYGLYLALNAKLDVFPDFVPPEVTIQAEAPGLSAEQVETLVTRPLESALNGLAHEESMRSESSQGLSVVTVVFADGTPILPARQMLAEKLGEVSGDLPAGVKAPEMEPLTSSTMDLLSIGLVSKKDPATGKDLVTPMELRTFGEWTLKPRILAVAGVAKCNIFGGEVEQWQIQVHPDLLAAYHLGIDDVLSAARLSTGVIGAGFIENANQRLVIQTEGQALTIGELENVVVATSPNGVPIRLKEVATVQIGAEPKFGDALIQGVPGVLMSTSNQYGSNTKDVTLALEKALDEMKPVFDREGITMYGKIHRPASFIEASLGNIAHSLILGAALVSVVLILFLGHFRTALILLTAIPLSLLSAVIAMDHFGISLNTITLGGLAIAIGTVVDDAIIVVENILRRMRENAKLPQPRVLMDVVVDASLEVRNAVISVTFLISLVFAPVLTLSGLQGSFFAPLALSNILAIVFSLIVALTVTPAMVYLFFANHKHEDLVEAPKVQVILRSIYTRILAGVSRHPRLIISMVLLLCVAALLPLPFLLGGSLLPDFREGHFVIGVRMAPGTSLPEMMRVGKQISESLLKNPHIATISQQAGRAAAGEDTWGTNQSEFQVELQKLPADVEAKVEDEIRTALDKIPGIDFDVVTFLGDRISESIGGERAPVFINIFGDDLDELDLKAGQIMAVLNSLGATEVQVEAEPGAPLINVKLRGERLTELGFRPIEVLEAVESAFSGTTVAQVYEGSQVSDVAVILDEKSRHNPADVGALLLHSPTGLLVPLRELADISMGTGRFSILHDAARRRQTVTCSPGDRDVTSFVEIARKAIAEKVNLPKGIILEFGGAAEQKARATLELFIHMAIASVGILMLLYIVLGKWRNLFLVLSNLPFAMVGGVVAVFLTSSLSAPESTQGFMHTLYVIVSKLQSLLHAGGASGMSMGSLVGFVTLFGITMGNSIMLLSHYEHLVREEGQTWNAATAMRGASERLVPILMTALVTALGLLPLAWGSGEAGREIEGPMAIVILGGLLTSTALNLLVMPTLASFWFVPRRSE